MKILVSDQLSKEGLAILKEEKSFEVVVKTKLSNEELKTIIPEFDAFIVRSGTKVTKEVIDAAENLKVIGRAGVGLDNVDVDAASKRGIIVMNTPEGNTVSTAEHTMSMILALSRNISQADFSIKSGKWDRKKFMGVELYDKVLGIVGLGRIGVAVAKRAASFGMKVIGYDPFLPLDTAQHLGVELVELEEIFKRADYITFHTPLTDETRHMIGDKEFDMMKKNVRIINCARGGIIDEDALAVALNENKISGAAIDVYEKEPLEPDSPLLKCHNILLTPHLGASTEEAQLNVAIDVAKQVRDVLLGMGIRNAINMPSLDPEILKEMRPFIDLAEKLGLFISQYIEGRITSVNFRYAGDITQHNTSPLSAALLKGILTPILKETVNYVNAAIIAEERRIKITESKTTIEDFANLILVELVTENGITGSITGTLFGKNDPRIVRIGGFHVDLVPSGYMIVVDNKDTPGIVGYIGTLLGEANINIAGMSFGREEPGGQAVTVLNVDGPVSQDVLNKLKKNKAIFGAKLIKL